MFYFQHAAGSLWAAIRHPYWNRPQVESFQAQRLKKLVRHAYEHVPFYRDLYQRHGIRPEEVRGLEDLERLPLAMRGDMQNRPFADLLARGADPAKLVRHRTSGSTGYPFTILRTRFEERLLQGVRLRQQLRRGLRPTDRRAIVSVGHGGRHEGPGIRLLNRLGLLRRYPVSCLLPPAEVLQRLREARLDTLAGYPDALALVAAEAAEEDRRRIRPRFVTTGGETLTPDMRRRISQCFRAPVYDNYGAHEFNLLAYECPKTGLYHVAEESVILEVLHDGRAASPGETGEVVATALHSFAMPFIRFWTGDLAVRGPASCPCEAPCGTLERILGRVIDRFLLPDGRRLHPYHLLEPLVTEAPWLSRYQLVQEAVDRVVLKMVPIAGAAPGPDDLLRLRNALTKPLGSQVDLVFELVRELPPAGSGKFRPYSSLVRS